MSYVTVLVLKNSSGVPRGWKVAYRQRDTIVHDSLKATDLDDARTEASARFPGLAVWVPSTGEPMPS
jgi:hypothetical protein